MFAGALACHVKSLNEHGIDLTANEDPPMRSPTHFFCPITHTHFGRLQLETGLFATYVNSPDECQLINSMLQARV